MPDRPLGTLRLLLRPSMFLLHVPAILGIVAAVLLGNWQLGAWQEHRADRTAELADATPVPLDDVLGSDDPFPGDGVGRPVTVSGRWLPDSSVVVSGRLQHGEDGFWSVVPLLACSSAGPSCADAAAIPVVVGWSASIDGLPPPPTGTADVVGWLQPGEAEALDEDPGDDVVPALRVADLLQRVDHDLYGGFVILRSPAAARSGLEAVTPDSLPEAPTSTALRNLLYGVQWWLFAGFAVFLWWRWTRDEVLAARTRASGVTPLSVDADDARTAVGARITSKP